MTEETSVGRNSGRDENILKVLLFITVTKYFVNTLISPRLGIEDEFLIPKISLYEETWSLVSLLVYCYFQPIIIENTSISNSCISNRRLPEILYFYSPLGKDFDFSK